MLFICRREFGKKINADVNTDGKKGVFLMNNSRVKRGTLELRRQMALKELEDKIRMKEFKLKNMKGDMPLVELDERGVVNREEVVRKTIAGSEEQIRGINELLKLKKMKEKLEKQK